MRFVTTAFALTEPRFDQTRTQSPRVDTSSPSASSSEISTKNSGCSTALTRVVLGPVVEVLGQTIRRRGVRKILRRSANCCRSSLNTRAAGLPRTFGVTGLTTGRFEWLVVCWETVHPSLGRVRTDAQTPSAFMMNGPTSSGFAVGAISGTS